VRFPISYLHGKGNRQPTRRDGGFLLALVGALLAWAVCLPTVVQADWIGPASGNGSYLNTSNWTGGTIDDNFSTNLVLTGALSVTLDDDRTTAADGLKFDFDGGTYQLSLRAEGNGRTLTLAGNISDGTLPAAHGQRIVTVGGGPFALTTLLGASRDITVVFKSDTLTFANSINNGSGISGITKKGEGTLVLSGVNGYTGTTHIQAGILRVGASDCIGGRSAIVLDNTRGAVFNLNGYRDTVGSLAGGGPEYGNVTLGAGGTLTTGGDNTSTQYDGTLSGIGAKLIKIGSGTMTLSNRNNDFSGGLWVNAGILNAAGDLGGPAGAIGATGGSPLGGGPVTVNGAELRVRNTNAPAATVAMERNVAFGDGGGILSFTGRNTSGSGFTVTTGTAGAAAAVIRYADGWDPSDWKFDNSFRLNGVSGSGQLRLELTNGAIATVAGGKMFGPAVTISGVTGGNPGAPTNEFNVGRFALVGSATTLTLTTGLVLENAVQVTIADATHTVHGNITLAAGAKVGFQGRGTTQGVYDALLLGASASDTLTINDGAEANIDSRFRSDAAYHGGVCLKATTIIKPGGTLRFRQSYNPGIDNTGFHQVDGDIQGESNAGKEAVVEVLLSNKTGNGGPTGGVNWSASTAKLVVNGQQTGGLRLQGSQQRLAAMLGAGSLCRLATVSGTGGYLTIAPSDTTYALPEGSEWIDNNVALKVIDSVPASAGADLSLANCATWNRNLMVDAGAELAVGAGGIRFTGTVTGSGTITCGPVTIDGAGTHAATAGGPLKADSIALEDGAVLSSDVVSGNAPGLAVGSGLTWSGCVTKSGAASYTLAYGGAPTGVTVASGAKLVVNAGTLAVAGTGDPFTQSSPTEAHLNVENNAFLDIVTGSKAVGNLEGTGGALVGTTTVEANAELVANYIRQDTLILGGAGATVVIRSSVAPGAADMPPNTARLAGGGNRDAREVPEPGTLVLLAAAGLILPLWHGRRRDRRRTGFPTRPCS
jgi:autotransporter-associated beta strand protein